MRYVDFGTDGPSPGADVARGEPSLRAVVARGDFSPGGDVARGEPSLRCRCGRALYITPQSNGGNSSSFCVA